MDAIWIRWSLWVLLGMAVSLLFVLLVTRDRRRKRDDRSRDRDLPSEERIEFFPRPRLSGAERLAVVLLVVVLAPLAINPALSLVFAVTVFPLGFVLFWGLKFFQRGKPVQLVERRLKLTSRVQEPLKIKHHWTVSTSSGSRTSEENDP